jgi:lipoprotein-anchoring transpeptidase ErfK/SrfK
VKKFKPAKLKSQFKKYYKKPKVRYTGFGLLVLVVLFVLLNVIVFFIFSSKTYPNTKLNNVSIGSVNYSKLGSKIDQPSIFPKSVTLKEGTSSVTTSPSVLGVSENKPLIEVKLKHKSWLPLANLWSSHTASLAIVVNTKTLNSELNQLAAKYNVSPVGAKISLSGANFSLSSNNNGYSLSEAQAAKVVASALKKNQTSIKLPVTKTTASVTSASLNSQLKSLQSALGLSIAYTYNGKVTTATSSDISDWYDASGNSYSLDSLKIKDFIESVGKTDGITVSNLNSAVSATESAIAKSTKLSYGLSAVTVVANTSCATNTLSQLILVSISARHLLACNGSTSVYDSPVVTGDTEHADTLTPIGTYHIYAKETNKTLTGSDENGSWSDFVNYWMPFLDNQYGTYGLHDATWRDASAFGNIDPDSSTASNGCVELPLATAKWLYNWDSVGTTVEIIS